MLEARGLGAKVCEGVEASSLGLQGSSLQECPGGVDGIEEYEVHTTGFLSLCKQNLKQGP